MARYVDGFVVAVPKDKVDEYRRVSRKAGKIWMEHGALQYVETVGEDIPTKAKVTSFPMSVKAKRNETVVFAWITYKSRAHRDKVNAKVMADERLDMMDENAMPFDMKRMIYGGFEVIVDL